MVVGLGSSRGLAIDQMAGQLDQR